MGFGVNESSSGRPVATNPLSPMDVWRVEKGGSLNQTALVCLADALTVSALRGSAPHNRERARSHSRCGAVNVVVRCEPS